MNIRIVILHNISKQYKFGLVFSQFSIHLCWIVTAEHPQHSLDVVVWQPVEQYVIYEELFDRCFLHRQLDVVHDWQPQLYMNINSKDLNLSN